MLYKHLELPGPHEVVQDQTCFDNELDSGWVMLHGTKQNLESVSHDAERIFCHPPCSGKPVVEDALFIRQTPEAVWLHHVWS